MIALLSATGVLVKYIKLWEYQLQKTSRFPEESHLPPEPGSGSKPIG
jgi:hypothetical protein